MSDAFWAAMAAMVVALFAAVPSILSLLIDRRTEKTVNKVEKAVNGNTSMLLRKIDMLGDEVETLKEQLRLARRQT